MLSKLSIRNVKRSIKDYLIYMVTVTIAFSLIFSFNLIAFSKDISELSTTMENFKYAIIFVSIIVVFVMGWLINYTMRFMFEKRSREFGTYLLLGIKKKDINKLFLLENIFLGFIAAILSFIIGIFIAIILSAIIMNIFEMPYKIAFSLHSTPCIYSGLYFIIIYLFALLRSRIRIKKMNIHDLLYFEKRNEQKMSKKMRSTTFIFATILGVSGLTLFDYAFKIVEEPTMMVPFFLSIILIGISIYGLTLSIGEFLLNKVLKHKNIKYKNDNLFIARNFSAKIKTMGITLGTLALLSTLTLISLNVSYLFKDAFENQVNSRILYDIMMNRIYSETDIKDLESDNIMDYREKYQLGHDYIEKTLGIKEEHIYNIYAKSLNADDAEIAHLLGEVNGNITFQNDLFIKLSDYNKLQKMLNREEITLNENEYFIHFYKEFKNWFEKLKEKNLDLHIQGKTLECKGMTYKGYTTSWASNGYYLIVVPDELVSGMLIDNTQNAINTEKETTNDFAKSFLEEVGSIELKSTFNGEEYTIALDMAIIRGEILADNRSAMTMFSFSLTYISLVFIAVVGTILSIQTLSDTTKYKFRYNLLKKLGVRERSINQTILKQVSMNFIFPIIYPILIAIITTFSLNRLFFNVTSEDYTYLYSLGNSLLLFLLIYLIYFLTTYFGFKKNIDE